MSKKAAVAIIGILAALVFFTGLALGATKTITGEVVSVEPSEKILVINAEGGQMTFQMAAKAARLVSHLFTGFLEEQQSNFGDPKKAASALTDLRPGDRVTVSYTEADGKFTAQLVTKG